MSNKIVKRVAADIGGTFTDIAAVTEDGDLLTWKLPSTPPNFADAVSKGIAALSREYSIELSDINEVLHGCTVATNAILEQKGAKTALITTRGFRDVLEIQRVRVPKLYDPLYEKPAPLVPRNLRFEIDERLDAYGNVIREPDRAQLNRVILKLKKEKIEALAICFLHSFVNPAHEELVGQIIQKELPDLFVSLSSEILPQKREYERVSTTVINSYVGPPVSEYLSAMVEQLKTSGISDKLTIMQSSGGILDAESCLRKPAHIVECGPAAGVVGAEHIASKAGFENVITLDMGGTTAKASIIEGGKYNLADEYEVGGGMSSSSALVGKGGYALKLPVIDIAEVGAGGGSIAWLDGVGSLKIGPESAGALPGPACYGLGGERPTVTDANLVLGYLNPKALAGGTVSINKKLSEQAINKYIAEPMKLDLMETAYGIYTVANASMMRAVRAVTTYRGRDPRDFILFAFGGAGGLHAVDLAKTLKIKEVLVPKAGGVFSALGLLYSNLETSETAPLLSLLDDTPIDSAEGIFFELQEKIRKTIGGDPKEITFKRFADLRFKGQAYELIIPFQKPNLNQKELKNLSKTFEEKHFTRYGHAFSGEFPIELVNLRLVGTKKTVTPELKHNLKTYKKEDNRREAYFGPAIGLVNSRVLSRGDLEKNILEGPLIIEDYEGTVVVPPGCEAHLDSMGNIVIKLLLN
ncbi:MAG: hydantoinase/oxoprolinase family protein [Pseudomonadota bacterium]|mgnify:FL=1|nr:hydantoinase/oxoprolinase family protein [Pseudomonadota bacterium]|tara:strand:+ start:1337 stop:3424 length:2088 start_codon:yes stop_codon:yes gene_type:complete